ncbi:MAG TPA: hypothetical protein DCX25_00445 [Candidatus Pacebacteria bacterium]|nr:MAG: hypothetical protein UX36_C0002G0104 [Microgenomates group bacterium GW2011_GWC1_46_15]KKU24836.1 MAG: hypothetical protein UX35_C0001G0018 [Microgenomates group bacterium GW2011_GWA1_46_15]HAV14790.1 hypothetical protein [Candidatus Paceibacterota bacterium]HCR11181.1 hypothetical protein [Candidatus Paceibacterota bacterium]
MRTLVLFFKYIIGAVLGSIALFLLFREAILVYTVFAVEQDLSFIKLLVKESNTYREQCLQKFTDVTGSSSLAGIQLRFIDSTTYNVEAICSFHDRDPLLIRSRTLPQFATKVPGSSGVFLSTETSYKGNFQIDIFGRKHTFAVEYTRQTTSSSSTALTSQSPATSCSGWGYTCCDSITGVPSGSSPGTRAIDCPTSCFAQCSDRPTVLAFRTDPPSDPATQTVVVPQSARVVTFSYAIGLSTGKPGEVQIDFGDGKQETSAELQGTFTHEYTCAGSSCTFRAVLNATDDRGISSPTSRGTQITVIVQ